MINVGALIALIISYTILGVPFYSYSYNGPPIPILIIRARILGFTSKSRLHHRSGEDFQLRVYATSPTTPGNGTHAAQVELAHEARGSVK